MHERVALRAQGVSLMQHAGVQAASVSVKGNGQV
jgi:hypothetical protein